MINCEIFSGTIEERTEVIANLNNFLMKDKSRRALNVEIIRFSENGVTLVLWYEYTPKTDPTLDVDPTLN